MNCGDIMKCLPSLHMSRRDWFDDEDDDDNYGESNNMHIVTDYKSLHDTLKNEHK